MQTNNWKWAKLGDIAEIIGGVSFDKADVQSEGIRILRGGNIQSGKIIHRSDDVFLPATYADCNNQVQYGDTVLVASTGSVEVLGKAATCFTEMKHCQIGAFLRIVRPKEAKYAMLVSCYLTSSYFSAYIQKQAKGTSINNIRNEHLKDFKVLVPNDEDLASFSAFYKNIESKLLLNRQINDNLEAMAKQLYDYWFVQFDFPNEEGKPYKSSGGKMVWNEKLKREIPEGWEILTIKDVCSRIQSGGTPLTSVEEYYNGDISWYRTQELCDKWLFESSIKISEEAVENSSAKWFDANTVVIAIYASPTCGRLGLLANGGTFNQACCGLIPSEKCSKEYLFMWLKENRAKLNTLASGTAQKNLNVDKVKNFEILMPENRNIRLWTKTVETIFGALKSYSFEMEQLTKQRDELLPLLMNGQVSVNYHLSDD